MRRLILFRHAKAEPPDGSSDHERSLVDSGRAAAAAMGRWLAAHDLRPDVALCSTAARARATWELASEAFEDAPEVRFEGGIYGASPETLLALTRDAGDDVRTLIIVGHNPGLGQFVEMLATKDVRRAAHEQVEALPTAGVAVLDLPDGQWRATSFGDARLDRIMAPKTLRDDGE